MANQLTLYQSSRHPFLSRLPFAHLWLPKFRGPDRLNVQGTVYIRKDYLFGQIKGTIYACQKNAREYANVMPEIVKKMEDTEKTLNLVLQMIEDA